VLRNTPYVPPEVIYVALYTTATDEAGGGTEVTAVATGYVRPTNSAGMIQVVQGSGVTAQDKLDIAEAVALAGYEGTLSLREAIRVILAVLAGKVSGAAGPEITFRDIGDTTDRVVATVDGEGNRTQVTLDAT
jgi:hypothetical protein